MSKLERWELIASVALAISAPILAVAYFVDSLSHPTALNIVRMIFAAALTVWAPRNAAALRRCSG